MTTDTEVWDELRGRIFSRKGGWRVGEGVFSHGYEIMGDLVGEASYFQVLLLNILGKLPERRLADWIEAMYICMSWPDPRIWCNQIGALGGTTRTSVVGATTAGILAADSPMYGSRPFLGGVGFIQKALSKHKNGLSTEEIVEQEIRQYKGKVHIVGYARPMVSGDERIPAMERMTRKYKFSQGPHLTLAYEIENILLRDHDERMNINGYVSAFMSDQGLNPEEIYRIYSLCIMSGITACYIEESDKSPESFLPLQCDDIDYQGKPPRKVT